MIAFGPVPSRRLGRSLGINNIPFKYCTYSCIYCQVGNTKSKSTDRRAFYSPADIYNEVQNLVIESKKMGHQIDYFTFVPDGEPTLDINLGQTIDLLKFLGSKIAVITNGSLLSNKGVQNNLMKADLISLKVDTVHDGSWHKLNRPCRRLKLSNIISSMIEFTNNFHGTVITETMLVNGFNTSEKDMLSTANIIKRLNPSKAYLSIPTRPPSEKYVKSPDEQTINRIYHIFNKCLTNVECLIEYEGDEFAYVSDVEKELLSITAVHPMQDDAVVSFLNKAKSDWKLINKLLLQEKLKEIEYNGHKFYMKCNPDYQS